MEMQWKSESQPDGNKHPQTSLENLQHEKLCAEIEARKQRERADYLEIQLRSVQAELEQLKQQVSAGSSCEPKLTNTALTNTAVEENSIFSGRVKQLQPHPVIECIETCILYDTGHISVSADSLPAGADIGIVLCFSLNPEPENAVEICPGSLTSAGECIECRFVGILKSVSARPSGERIGWANSCAIQQLYGCDVYVHGTMLECLGIGDVVSFHVHVNGKGQPQVSTGTILKHASPAPGLSPSVYSKDGSVNAVANQIGKVIPLKPNSQSVNHMQYLGTL